jgi:hypothetical protein
MYHPGLGRWMTVDPIGFDAGDNNLYGYVGNNATNRLDPSGLQDALRAKPPTETEQKAQDRSAMFPGMPKGPVTDEWLYQNRHLIPAIPYAQQIRPPLEEMTLDEIRYSAAMDRRWREIQLAGGSQQGRGGPPSLGKYPKANPNLWDIPTGSMMVLPTALRAITFTENGFGTLSPGEVAEAIRIGRAIQYTFDNNSRKALPGQHRKGYFCYEWAYAFEWAAAGESSGNYFTTTCESASTVPTGKGLEHAWLKITNKRTGRSVYIDDGFMRSGPNGPIYIHTTPPMDGDYIYPGFPEAPKMIWNYPDRYNAAGKIVEVGKR